VIRPNVGKEQQSNTKPKENQLRFDLLAKKMTNATPEKLTWRKCSNLSQLNRSVEKIKPLSHYLSASKCSTRGCERGRRKDQHPKKRN
jgi:hypothetical protein